MAVRHGGARSAHHRRHAGDARGSGLVEFSKRFPDRYFDVAIAEQHAVTFADGDGRGGLKAVVANLLDVPAAGYRSAHSRVRAAEPAGGLCGGPAAWSGATRDPPGSYDLSYLRCIPNTVIIGAGGRERVPADAVTASTLNGPAIVRYPRGAGPGAA